RADEVDSTGDPAPRSFGHHQQDALAHRFADEGKELAREIWAAPFARAGLHVEGKERIPDCFRQIAAGEPVHADAVRQSVLAFAADSFAFARSEHGEEILERRVPGVFPVELLIVALKESEFAEK